jgi:hypothetical protein
MNEISQFIVVVVSELVDAEVELRGNGTLKFVTVCVCMYSV